MVEAPAPVGGDEYEPGDQVDLTDELLDMGTVARSVQRVQVPARERTRRGVPVGLALGFAAVLLLQVGFALVLDAAAWARVGPVLSSFATIVAGGLGAAFGYYFSGRD